VQTPPCPNAPPDLKRSQSVEAAVKTKRRETVETLTSRLHRRLLWMSAKGDGGLNVEEWIEGAYGNRTILQVVTTPIFELGPEIAPEIAPAPPTPSTKAGREGFASIWDFFVNLPL